MRAAPLSRVARGLLDEVRDAEDPTPEDEARVKRALDAAIVAGAPCRWERDAGQTSDAPRVDPVGGAAAASATTGAAGTSLTVLVLCAAALFAGGDADRARPPSVPACVAAPSATEAHTAPETPRGAVEPHHAREPRQEPAASGHDAAGGRSKAQAPPARSRAAAPRASSGLGAELEQLQKAQAALRRGDGAAALHELDAVRGPGQLLGERRAARLLALCSLGRDAEARALATELLRDEPDSLQRAAIERSCANPSRIGGPRVIPRP